MPEMVFCRCCARRFPVRQMWEVGDGEYACHACFRAPDPDHERDRRLERGDRIDRLIEEYSDD